MVDYEQGIIEIPATETVRLGDAVRLLRVLAGIKLGGEIWMKANFSEGLRK